MNLDWWVWLIIAVVALVLLFIAFLAIQARRRAGGVITGRKSGGGGS